MVSAILNIACEDRKGLVAALSGFVSRANGNIVALDEFVDPVEGSFFMRLEWDLQGFAVEREDLPEVVESLALENGFSGRWELFFSDVPPRMAVFVSKYDHCLYDLLLRHRAGELKCDIPLILSNHEDLRPVADVFGVEFHCVPVTKAAKSRAEEKQTAILEERRIDFIVLARYMQILSPDFVSRYKNRIINIHHSFLPAFEGARPYHQARERGVKIIGATAHFVNGELDGGPIIRQAVIDVSHKDSVEDLVIKGRDIERLALAEAVKLFIGHRLFVYANRTVIL